MQEQESWSRNSPVTERQSQLQSAKIDNFDHILHINLQSGIIGCDPVMARQRNRGDRLRFLTVKLRSLVELGAPSGLTSYSQS